MLFCIPNDSIFSFVAYMPFVIISNFILGYFFLLSVETQEVFGGEIILDEQGTFKTCFHLISHADYISVKTKDNKKI